MPTKAYQKKNRKTSKTSKGNAQSEVFQAKHAVVNRIIESLERGEVPMWKRSSPMFIPKNATTGRAYRGQNVLVLMNTQIIDGYSASRWMGEKQAADWIDASPELWAVEGQRPRLIAFVSADGREMTYEEYTAALKIEKLIAGKFAYTPIIKMSVVDSKDKKGQPVWEQGKAPGQNAAHPQGVQAKKSWVSYHRVYNLAQIKGLKAEVYEQPRREISPDEAVEQADAILEAAAARLGVKIIPGEWMNPSYVPDLDQVQMPYRSHFTSDAEYLSVKAHELIHSTGDNNRLTRDLSGNNMNDDYAEEELIAAFGQAIVMATLGIENVAAVENITAYLHGWGATLKANKDMFQRAATAAQKAVDYLLGDTLAQAETE